MAASATLNAQKCQSPQYASTKSTTYPCRSRSIRLPAAPPRISASPSRASQCAGGSCDRVERHTDERAERHDRDDDRLAGKIGGVQEPERRPRVPNVGQIEQPADDRHALVQPELEHDDSFVIWSAMMTSAIERPLEAPVHERAA